MRQIGLLLIFKFYWKPNILKYDALYNGVTLKTKDNLRQS